MTIRNSGFHGRLAPCGQVASVESHEDVDDDTQVTEALTYSCGCRSIRHEYHDGSLSNKVIRHDGKVLVDEFYSSA